MKAYIAGDNMITSLGFTTRENMQNMKAGMDGVRMHVFPEQSKKEVPISLVDHDRLEQLFAELAGCREYTRLEKLAIASIRDAVHTTGIDLASSETRFILSTTKGNIDLLENDPKGFGAERQRLWNTALILADYFQNPNPPLVVSNACISGILALLTGQRLISEGQNRHVVVVGVDLATHFVLSGFQAFKATSPTPCRPFDSRRDGLSLGEGAATVLLTADAPACPNHRIIVRGGASANDANHISGPSATGDGLYQTIENTLQNTGQARETIDHISAHGTATRYNDDMESMALTRAGLENVPVNSLKGFLGHTLGAAGVLETVVSCQSMRENLLLKTRGCENYGTVKSINVLQENRSTRIDHCLKIGSGFGGCNAGLLLSKEDAT